VKLPSTTWGRGETRAVFLHFAHLEAHLGDVLTTCRELEALP
jgi:hypothetical protein